MVNDLPYMVIIHWEKYRSGEIWMDSMKIFREGAECEAFYVGRNSPEYKALSPLLRRRGPLARLPSHKVYALNGEEYSALMSQLVTGR